MAASAPEVWVIDDDSSVSEQGNDDRTQQQVSNKGEEYAEVQHVLREIRNESGQILSQDEEQVQDGGEEEEEGDETAGKSVNSVPVLLRETHLKVLFYRGD